METSRCWAEIDLGALRRNAAACRAASGGRAIMAILKAGAYGHGAAAAARALAGSVESFGVASLAEARELAEALGGPDPGSRVLILGPVLPGERAGAAAGGFGAPVSSPGEAMAFARAAREAGRPARLHAVVDTGMGRMGASAAEFPALVAAIREEEARSGAIRLDGVATHFPSADEDPDYTREQIDRFRELTAGLGLPTGTRVHAANSAGLLGYGEELGFTTEARPGLALYGVSPLPEWENRLVPALAWKTRVALVRDLEPGDSVSYGRSFVAPRAMKAATLAAGYADGYPRHVSGRGMEVLVGGRRCPLLGRVTMDQMVADVSALPLPPEPGDEAVLLGSQGGERITAAELAAKAGTISWEILTRITSRVARIYREGVPEAPPPR